MLVILPNILVTALHMKAQKEFLGLGSGGLFCFMDQYYQEGLVILWGLI